jgi:L-ascorbate metabolism protein UlaG (beta-lactamase superfamily)
MAKAMKEFYVGSAGKEPKSALPHVRHDLQTLEGDGTSIVWFGHSSYLIQTGRVRLLVDPVFAGFASPFSFFARSFPGSNPYKASDMPPLDAVVITHDHYDHLDYATIRNLIPGTRKFYTSLGVGSHLKKWGVPDDRIIEMDWWESLEVASGVRLTAAPARHFSGRGLRRFTTLWSSFALETEKEKLYLGSDSGYDSHFREIGDRFGGFDIALLECGQYNRAWPYIHMMPEEVVRAAKDVNASVLMPVHWGKFRLAPHSWTDPIERVVASAEAEGVNITTPMIGERVTLGESLPSLAWWKDVV